MKEANLILVIFISGDIQNPSEQEPGQHDLADSACYTSSSQKVPSSLNESVPL